MAVLIVLAIVVGISIISINGANEKSKKNTERIFIKSLEQAIGAYLETNATKSNDFNYECNINKKNYSSAAYRGKRPISFNDIFNSEYSPMSKEDFVNPVNKDVKCDYESSIIQIFKDDDQVYYYLFSGSDLGCIKYHTDDTFSSFPADKCFVPAS